ncbi:hypothetical protein SLEP1_g55810 [Rubroshorea leprosula]|uniref:Uncharacterized protein n=1 Tax=Rubroshorea leprosula TaxID=152421 RepID=A0AAV5MJK6_9ROSI|nr:hypothetical protein SLEP1_g55810 [Rubroshorea leprosula]
MPILAQSVGNWQEKSQAPVSDEPQVLSDEPQVLLSEAPICADDGEAVEEGGINDDAHGVNFKIASNGEGQQEKECGREVKPISMLHTF